MAKTNTIERKIFFFRIMGIPYEDGEIPEIPVDDTLQQIMALRFQTTSTGSRSRYMDWGSSVVCAWPSLAGNRQRLELGKIRRDDLPALENGGDRRNLPVDEGDGLSESIHVEFFDNHIVGSEFNFYGPRTSAFSHYCAEKLPNLPRFSLYPLLNRNAIEQLNDVGDLRMFSVRVHASRAELLSAANQAIPGLLESLASQYDGEMFEITIKPKRGNALKSRLVSAAKAMIRSSDSPARDFDAFHLRGVSESTGYVEEFDLLKDRFVQVVEVQKVPKHRSVVSESMYSAIENAYNDLRDELESAPALGIIDDAT